MEPISSEADYRQAKQQYYYMEHVERSLRKKLRLAGRAGDKQRADALWQKTQDVAEQRKNTAFYKQFVRL
jgi:hypothetical protein